MSINNNAIVQTVSGLYPKSDTRLEYSIHTGMIEKFVRERFKQVNESLIRTNSPHADIDYDNDITVKSVVYSRKFMPLVLIMPGSVIDSSRFNPKTPAMFRNDERESAVLIDPYFKLIEPWLYKKHDTRALLESGLVQRRLKIDRKDAHDVAYWTELRTKSPDGDISSDSTVCSVVLAPEKLFHTMLRDRHNMKQRFDVEIISLKATGDDNAIYGVTRTVTKRKDVSQRIAVDKISEILANNC